MVRVVAAVLLLAAFQATVARATLYDDRVNARMACYKECLGQDGYDPVCVMNPNFPKPTTHGGGPSVWPNACTAQCMAKYCKYGEWCRLDTLYRVKLPAICYSRAWDIFIGLTTNAPQCKDGKNVCIAKNKVAKQPPYKPLPEDQCNKACRDRDGWKPVCVKDFMTNKKVAFGNACAAACSKLSSPTPLYYINRPNGCKSEFTKTGKMGPACSKCPAGKEDPNLNTEIDRIVAREYCYKACISSDGWAPVCAVNPKFPRPTTHGGGESVWPNACTMECMNDYCKYAEYCDLQVKRKITLPKACKDNLWKIYYLTANEPSAPESLRKKCTTCPK